MLNRSRLLGLLVLFVASVAQAYIPPYWMILSRTAQNHGKGAFVIDQDVTFSSIAMPGATAAAGASKTSGAINPTSSLMAHERWTILNESEMRLDVDGLDDLRGKLHLSYIYKDGRRWYISETGSRRVQKAPDSWFEPFFFFRTSKRFKVYAASIGVTPPESTRSEPQKYSKTHPLPQPEPFMRLSRVDGTVSYAIGEPSPVGSTALLPGLWIEQDQFNVKKIRFPSSVEVLAQKYRQYKTLWLPQVLKVSWPQSQAQISVTRVIATQNTKALKKRFDLRDFSASKDPNAVRFLPSSSVVSDFYSRLR